MGAPYPHDAGAGLRVARAPIIELPLNPHSVVAVRCFCVRVSRW